MGRSNSYYEQPLRSYEGLLKRPYRMGTPSSEEAHVMRIYWSGYIQRIIAVLRAMEAWLGRSNCTYDRAVLFLFCIVALALRKNRRQAHRFVQESNRLRLMVGLPPLSRELRDQINAAEDDEDVPEPGFPTRQMIGESVDWIERWLTSHPDVFEGVDLKLNFMRREAYDEVVVDILKRHPEIRTDFFAIDGKRIPSAVNEDGPRQARRDPEARGWSKRGAWIRGREKFTAALGDIPIVFYGQISTEKGSELSFLQSTFVPNLVGHIDHLRARADEAPALAGLNGAVACGDGTSANNKILADLYDHDLVGAFRKPNGLVRKVIGQRRVHHRTKNITLDLDVCDNGDHFCPCDAIDHDENCDRSGACTCRRREPHERTPMTHNVHGYGIGGGVHVKCKQDFCPARNVAFYVSFQRPNLTEDGNLVVDPGVEYQAMSPLWRADIRYHAMVFKATQAIEHYHGHLYTLLGLSTETARDGLRFFGTFAHNFWFTLADLIWNLTIGFNLDKWKKDGRTRETIDWEAQFMNAVGNWHQVWIRTDGKRLPGESERERGKRIREAMPHIGHYYLGAKQIC